MTEPADSPSQCASAPSPRQETRPMPVITASRPSLAMAKGLQREFYAFCRREQHVANTGSGKRQNAESYLRGTYLRTLDEHLILGHREAGALVQDAGVDLQPRSGLDAIAQLGFLDGGKKRHAIEASLRQQDPACSLRHALDEQYSRHYRVVRKMALEDGAFRRD